MNKQEREMVEQMKGFVPFELLPKANGNYPRTDREVQHMIHEAAKHYGDFLTALGFDWKADPNSANTPHRVAKAWMNDLIKGTHMEEPKISRFPAEGYDGIVFQGNIELVSLCSHHNLAFTGKVHVGYILQKTGMVIGLSKLNRIVDFYGRRPQIQEGLTQQIHDKLNELIDNDGIAVVIEANHTCCSNRGIGHNSTMMTSKLSGLFFTNQIGTRAEFYKMIDNLKK